MSYCPNCGTEYAALPQRCQCGYLFVGSSQTAQQPGRFEFTGEGSELLLLYIKIFFFSIFTLGIYSFWGKVELRKYFYRNTRFAGHPLEFHGTGGEMFMGALKLFGLLIVFGIGMGLLQVSLGETGAIITSLIYILFFPMLGILALHGAVRYRWSRTTWQGRPFVYHGQLAQFEIIALRGLLLSIVTLGVYIPFLLIDLRSYITNNTSFGGQRFSFSGTGKDLLHDWIIFLISFLPTLGLYRFWFEARLQRYTWTRTTFAGVPFDSTVDGFALLKLWATNWLLTFFTLGIFYSWGQCRSMRYWAANHQLTALPWIQLNNETAAAATAFGDVLGQSLGTDAGLDAGFGL